MLENLLKGKMIKADMAVAWEQPTVMVIRCYKSQVYYFYEEGKQKLLMDHGRIHLYPESEDILNDVLFPGVFKGLPTQIEKLSHTCKTLYTLEGCTG